MQNRTVFEDLVWAKCIRAYQPNGGLKCKKKSSQIFEKNSPFWHQDFKTVEYTFWLPRCAF